MWKLLLPVALATVGLSGQAISKKQHISGVVVDQSGKPVPEAAIDHVGGVGEAFKTDSAGHFELDTAAPAGVIRKLGYESRFFQIVSGKSLGLTLLPGPEARELNLCHTERKDFFKVFYRGMGSFHFPRVSGIKEQQSEHDFVEGNATVRFAAGRRGELNQTGGGNWSPDAHRPDPSVPDRLVWATATFEETPYEYESPPEHRVVRVIDARGRLPNGKLWRILVDDGEEAAEYNSLDDRTAARFDRMLDGVCAALPVVISPKR